MSTLIRPVGPKPPTVYWRRRLAVLLLAALVALVVLLMVRLVGPADGAAETGATGSRGPEGAAPAAASPSSSASSSMSPSASPTSTEGGAACDGASLEVTVTSDATTYAAGAEAELGMVIRNVGSSPCTVDAGSAALEYLVVSGSDRIWSSDDCQEKAASAVHTVPAGGELASAVVWPVVRSAPGCPPDQPAPRAGTYQLTGRVGEITSEPLVFSIG